MDSERARLQSMRAMAREPSPAPWIAAAILTALAFGVGRFTRGEALLRPSRPRALGPAAPVVDRRPDDLDALRGCVGELGALQARIDRECPALAGATGAEATVDGGTGPGAEEQAAEAARRAAFRKELVARVVGVTGTAGEWLADYVCLADAMHDRTVREIEATMKDPAAAPASVDEIIGDAREELDAIHGDIEARLGPQRYARLREAGGLAILSLACAERPEAPSEEPASSDAGVPEPK